VNKNETIHWCDWASQPEIRIACSQVYHRPWTKRKDLPRDVHEVPVKDLPSILYTFNVRLVTCRACQALSTFKKAHELATNYDRRLAESGMTPEEFAKHEHAEFMAALAKRAEDAEG
jgi:hypothetical protein